MSDTENKIKKATIDLLLKEGNFGFTMYDVAERSKANRTVIHYYFRSRDNLQAIVTKEILTTLVQPRYETLTCKDDLKSKILNFLEESDRICKLYPYIDVFIMIRHNVSHDLQKFFQDILESFKDLLLEVQEAIDSKELNYPDAQVFLSDLFSLSSFSYVFNNFFSTLKIPSYTKSIFDDRNNKNRRIMNILFERK